MQPAATAAGWRPIGRRAEWREAKPP